jgi:hypothetical protein
MMVAREATAAYGRLSAMADRYNLENSWMTASRLTTDFEDFFMLQISSSFWGIHMSNLAEGLL